MLIPSLEACDRGAIVREGLPVDEEAIAAARAFVDAFVLLSKREKYLRYLRRERDFPLFLQELDHLRFLDMRFVEELPPAIQDVDRIEQLLRRHGAPSECVVVSSCKSECGTRGLRDALIDVVGATSGAIISCVPGRLAYYESESPQDRHICLSGGTSHVRI